METALVLSSFPNASVHDGSDKDSGETLSSPTGSSPVLLAKPKARKQGGGAASAPKRIPQRGLGVAKLEHIRLQEHFQKLSAGIEGVGHQLDLQQRPCQIRPVPTPAPAPAALYGNQQHPRDPSTLGFAVPRYGVPGSGSYLNPAPSPAVPVPAMESSRYIHLFTSPAKMAAAYGGAPPPEDARYNVISERHRMLDFFRTTAGVSSGDTRPLRSFGVAFQEPPSTQIGQFHSPNNDLFKRTQKTMHLVDYFDVNAAAAATGTVHQEASEVYGSHESKGKPMKEFEFFPVRSNTTSSTSSHAHSADDASAPTSLDLSLKL